MTEIRLWVARTQYQKSYGSRLHVFGPVSRKPLDRSYCGRIEMTRTASRVATEYELARFGGAFDHCRGCERTVRRRGVSQ